MSKQKPGPVICPYCGAPAGLTDGREVYPYHANLWHKSFWICRPCDAYVGCHTHTTKPLGRLADKDLRFWKQRAHEAFDPLWVEQLKEGVRKFEIRKRAYKWLGKQLGLKRSECHIGMMDIEQCRAVVNICYEARQRKRCKPF